MSVHAQLPLDDLLARKLGSGKTVAEAASATRVSPSTVYRRLRDPDFRILVDEIRIAAVDTLRSQLVSSGSAARETLHGLLGSVSETIQLRAARTLIELSFKFYRRDEVIEQSHANEPTEAQTRVEPAPAAVIPCQEAVTTVNEIVPTDLAQEREQVIANAVKGVDSGRDTRQPKATPSLPALNEKELHAPPWELSNSVTACHRPVDLKAANGASQLSAGLRAALDQLASR